MRRGTMHRLAVISVLALVSVFPAIGAATADPNVPLSKSRPLADFNGDGYQDLAVGVPLEDVTSGALPKRDAGAVNVIYGSPAGLTSAGNEIWTQDSPGVLDVVETGDQFGAALTWGRFNTDTYSDLAIGVPNEDVGTISDAGAVAILYGSASGLTSAGDQLWTQDSAGIADAAEGGDHFGSVLDWSYFGVVNAGFDSAADLVVGVPSENLGALSDAGAVHILMGSGTGITSAGSQYWTQDSAGIGGVAESGDHFGGALSSHQFGKGSNNDLAVGVPFEDLALIDEGAVNVIYGSDTVPGLTSTGNQVWTQDSTGIADAAEAGDRFGSALASADFGEPAGATSSTADLAIGTPYEDQGTTDSGLVQVIYGHSVYGLVGVDSYHLGGGSGDRFGFSLAAADFGHDESADLAIGVPYKDLGTRLTDAGQVEVLYGSVDGLTSFGSQVWTQNSAGPVEGVAQANDHFGYALATANFGRSFLADLAVGVPADDVGAAADAGAVNVLYSGGAGGIWANADQLWSQDSTGVLGVAEGSDNFGKALVWPF
jgi:FG-GAP repeat protein